MQQQQGNLDFEYRYGFAMPQNYVFKAKRGLNQQIVKEISWMKKEPQWMTDFRLKSYDIFTKKIMPTWGPDLSRINFDDIYYYIKPIDKQASSWEDLPKEIKETYDRIGVPEAEKKFLAGVSAQYESEVIYESINRELNKLGVIFCDMDTALRKYPQIVREYFGTLIPPHDNKFAALNSAVWSGGSFVYVPKGVKVSLPLQAYFRINAENFGQFERTLIIGEEGSQVHYIEGCLPAGEKISIGQTWANIETVKPGDFVMTGNGYLSKVSKVMVRKYKGRMYKITPISPVNSFSLTKEHPILSIKRKDVLVKRKIRNNWLPEVDSKKLVNEVPVYRKVTELERGDFIIFPKPKKQFLKQTLLTDEEIEFLGFYTAEGSLHFHKKLRQYIVALTFSEKEEENIERVKELIFKITGKKAMVVKSKEKHAVTIVIYSLKLHDLCLRYVGKHAYKKKLNDEILNLSNTQLENFFWAYFKGDGNLFIKTSSGSHLYRASTASYELAIQLQEILAKIGIFASMQFRKGGEDIVLGRTILRKDQYIIAFTKPKQWTEVRETEDYYIVPIKKIEETDFDDFVFNLEVEGANSYLVKGFAVHNCTAPVYTTDSLHAAVVEIFVKKGARVRYTTVQNWSKNVYNLVTKRARAEKEAFMEWIDCNLGSQITMKYPSVYLYGEGAKGEVLSIAFAGKDQLQDAGAKMLHFAPNTSSRIVSKSISKSGGRTSYRGLVQVFPGAKNSSVYVSCDALILDKESRSDTYPSMKIKENDVTIQHEATVEKLGDEKLLYLMSRGIKKTDAEGLIVNGFIEPVVREIPLEYSIELNRLINLEMSGSVG
ncbi:Fe-S cluster assembly protein SufB [Candidatus Roizmanbacteria bacterium]|nr:Fe-S cluster assembly protein SufB [Candidatus Roizmanbacteria bacterium]